MDTDKTSQKPKLPSKPTKQNAKPEENVSAGGFQELLKLPEGTKFRVLPDKPK